MILVFRGIAEVVFLEMGQTSVNNNFLKILNRNGRSEMGQSFCIIFLSRDGLFNRGLTIAVFISCGTMP